MALQLSQKSSPGTGTWWKWSVWVEGPTNELADIEFVVYTLHPTFPDPIRTVKNAKTKFQLDETGWGEFQLVARVVKKKGKPVTLKHWLRLGDEATDAKPRVFISSSVADAEWADELSQALTDNKVEIVADDDPTFVDIKSKLSRATGMVVLVSDKPSPWVKEEIKAARSLGINVVPVGIGTVSGIKQMKVAMPKPNDAGRVAKVIANQLRVGSNPKDPIFATDIELDGLLTGVTGPFIKK